MPERDPAPGQSTSREARTAARWWADKIRDGFTLRDGAEDYAGGLSERSGGLSDILQRRLAEKVIPEKVDRYEQELAARIQTEIMDAYADPDQTMTSDDPDAAGLHGAECYRGGGCGAGFAASPDLALERRKPALWRALDGMTLWIVARRAAATCSCAC